MDVNDKILILACGALAREIIALQKMNNWAHMELQCLPAILHLHPDKITSEVRKAVAENKEKFSKIFVAYADCGTGGQLVKACEEMGVEMIKGPHCYSFFDGNDKFAARGDDEMRVFYLTDFLARQFDAFVTKPMGLDKNPELRDMIFGNYEKLVYLAQTDDPELDQLAQIGAQKLGLVYERRFTGYGDLETALGDLK